MKKYFALSTYRQALLGRLARLLRPHLARTPLIWGDASRLTVGRNVQLVDAIINLRSGDVIIEDEVFFGHGVMLLTGKHSVRKTGMDRQSDVPDRGRDIVIRKGAWLASGVIVIGPCEIGENAVVGAGCVVSGQIAAGTIYSEDGKYKSTPIDFS